MISGKTRNLKSNWPILLKFCTLYLLTIYEDENAVAIRANGEAKNILHRKMVIETLWKYKFLNSRISFFISLLLVKNAVVVRSNGEAKNIFYPKMIIESSLTHL